MIRDKKVSNRATICPRDHARAKLKVLEGTISSLDENLDEKILYLPHQGGQGQKRVQQGHHLAQGSCWSKIKGTGRYHFEPR